MFKTVAEAFNAYRNSSLEDIEKRAAAIGQEIDSNANADVAALNIELDGLKEAKANLEQRSAGTKFNPVTGMAFGQPAAPEGDVLASAEYRSAFFKNMLGQQMTTAEERAFKRGIEKRDSVFNTVTNAAAVLPTATLNEVIAKARTMGGLLPNCRNFALPTKVSVPIATPAGKASWHVEGAAVDTENASVASVAFGGYEILKVMSISAAAKTMSIAAFEQYLVEELTACVMAAIADAVVNGVGTTQGTGLETITWTPATNAITYTNATIPTYTNFVSTMALLKRGYAAGAKWAMNNATLYTHVYNVVDDNKRPIFIADPKNEAIGYILGHEVVIDDNIADGDIYLGNFAYFGYNIPSGIVVEVSRDSSFKSGLIDYRAIAVADCKPLVNEAFVKLYEAAGA